MRIGLVPFLNVAPFADIPYDIIYDVPSRLNRMMRHGELDVAFSSSAEYFEGEYDRLGNLGLAARGAIRSVNLYLKGKLDGARIFLDPKSATSNALLKILCGNQIKIVPTREEADGFLVIGDEALKQPSIEGYQTIDLATWWFEKTQLPFVFALFIKQKGLETKHLEDALHTSLENFSQKIPNLAQEERFPEKALREYFDLCHYKLGPEEEKGLQEFHDRYTRLNQGVLFKHSS